jgi:hypothetical protein
MKERSHRCSSCCANSREILRFISYYDFVRFGLRNDVEIVGKQSYKVVNYVHCTS